MFDYIEDKLRLIAMITFVLGIIAGVIMVIVAIEIGVEYLILGIVSFFSCWVSSVLLYAFAEIVETLDSIKSATKETKEHIEEQTKLMKP